MVNSDCFDLKSERTLTWITPCKPTGAARGSEPTSSTYLRRRFTWITPCKPTGAARGEKAVSNLDNSVGVQPATGLGEGQRCLDPELHLSACKGLSMWNSYGDKRREGLSYPELRLSACKGLSMWNSYGDKRREGLSYPELRFACKGLSMWNSSRSYL